MGEGINSSALDFCPALTPDGGGFLFSSRRSTLSEVSTEKRTYTELSASLRAPGNGKSDLYWIDAGFIEVLNDR